MKGEYYGSEKIDSSFLFGFGFVSIFCPFWKCSFRETDRNKLRKSFPTHPHPVHITGKLGQRGRKTHQGKVKVTYYSGGTLLKGPKIFGGIVDGIADMGGSVLGYSRGVFPSMEAIDLPLGYPSGVVATNVIKDDRIVTELQMEVPKDVLKEGGRR